MSLRFVLAALGVAALACKPDAPGVETNAEPTNFVLLTLDTLRADRIGAYGYDKAETPNLDALASDGVRFTEAVSSAPLTLPSHSTIMTGLFPMGHGVRDNGTFHLSDKHRTLAEILKNEGYDTAAFISAFVIDSRFGIAQGFDTYFDFDDEEGASGRALRALSEVQRRGGETVRVVLDWLSEPRDAPFFLWVHLYDPHYPFDPPEPYRSRFPDDRYDGEVAYTDSVVGRILERLERMELDDETLVMVVGDHGESLGEHGEELHSWFVYDSVLLVPFIVRMPGEIPAGSVIEEQVRLADVAPTALELLGLSPNTYDQMQGRSLAGWMKGDPEREELPGYAESLVANLQFGWGELKSIRARGHKYIRAPRAELYDLGKDPAETENLANQRANVARQLHEMLTTLENEFGDPDAEAQAGATDLDEETRRKLESLGYLASSSGTTDPSAANVDPKDRIDIYQELNHKISEATDALDDDRPETAIQLLTPLAQQVPGNVRIHHLLGQGYLASKNHGRAIEELEIAVARDPNFAVARTSLARALVLAGQPDRAVELLEDGLARQPGNSVFLFHLGSARHRLDDLEGARVAYEEALDAGGPYPQLLSTLGMLYLQIDEAGLAVEQFEHLVEMEPRNGLHWNNLGLAYAQVGRLTEAGPAFEKAVELAPDQFHFRRNLDLWRTRMKN